MRLLAVLDVLFKYACARLFPPPGSRLVLTALSRTSPRRVVRNAGQAFDHFVRSTGARDLGVANPATNEIALDLAKIDYWRGTRSNSELDVTSC